MENEPTKPREYSEPRAVSLYRRQWSIVDQYAERHDYNVSAALRRIIDEWAEEHMIKQLPLSEMARMTQFEDA